MSPGVVDTKSRLEMKADNNLILIAKYIIYCVYYEVLELRVTLANRIFSTFSKRNVLVPLSTTGECLFDVLGILCHATGPTFLELSMLSSSSF